MHPAYSVIIFTTFSGAGYGLLIMMAAFALAGGVPPNRGFAALSFGLAFVMIIGGLLSSTFHLGHPERAWRAFSQWKTSWLSREGVLAVGTFIPALLFAFGWVVLGDYDGPWRLLAGMTIMLSFMTVYSTAMIYASLRTIRAWFNPHTIRVYLAYSLWSGSLWFNFLAHLFGIHTPWIGVVFVITGLLAFFFKRKYWIYIDRHPAWVTPETATGLGDLGKVKLLDAPNTQENYVQQEMGYRVARRHSERLRRWAFMNSFLLPWCIAAFTVEMDPWIKTSAAFIAVALMTGGTLVERWLFFAEAKHTASLYYGAADS
jgi:DMSO reductase anchor subunit